MGVPALFRFLSRKYPKIITQVIEESPEVAPDGSEIPVDCTKPNPLGEEIDNLYLDMNGIVHPCSHPENEEAPKTEDDMMMAVFRYTDRIMAMVRPRKLLYIAVDGVAPRAKMNQQRSRRFRAALDVAKKAEDMRELIKLLREQGEQISDDVANKKTWDSNAITPGTPFMDILATALRFYVQFKLNSDPAWRELNVIVSDASVPGEGEHKVMNFIRSQRSAPNHDPNNRHALYGLDADLIMLGLATHEPHFRILREDVFFQEGSKKTKPAESLKESVLKLAKEEQAIDAGTTNTTASAVAATTAITTTEDITTTSVASVEATAVVSTTAEKIDAEGNRNVNVANSEANGDSLLLPSDDENDNDETDELSVSTNGAELQSEKIVEAVASLGEDRTKIKKPFIWLNVAVLREYLQVELFVPDLSFRFDFERAIDDYVFFIFFVGNDFLPHLPSLDIREGAIDTLTNIWKRTLQRSGGFLTLDGIVNLKRAQIILQELGKMEDSIFRRRKDREERRKMQTENQNRSQIQTQQISGSEPAQNADIIPPWQQQQQGLQVQSVSFEQTSTDKTATVSSHGKASKKAPPPPPSDLLPSNARGTHAALGAINREILQNRAADRLGQQRPPADISNKSAAAALKMQLNKQKNNNLQSNVSESEKKRKAEAQSDELIKKPKVSEAAEDSSNKDIKSDQHEKSTDDTENKDKKEDNGDEVRLWEPGYKDRYYRTKFNVSSDDVKVSEIVRSYIEGFSWVLLYYYQGCPSWTWFYPYHYAPFASDFQNIADLKIEFEQGTPFKPFEQLLGVLPAASKDFLPEPLQELMIGDSSSIKDFYPEEFEIDMNGAKFSWQGIALLPFIDQDRLLSAAKDVYKQLSDEEHLRNDRGRDILYISHGHPLYGHLVKNLYEKKKDRPERIDLPNADSKSLVGRVCHDENCIPRSCVPFPLRPSEPPLEDIQDDSSLSVTYEMPQLKKAHKSMLLRGVRLPPAILNRADLSAIMNRNMRDSMRRRPQHQQQNFRPSFVSRFYGQSDHNAPIPGQFDPMGPRHGTYPPGGSSSAIWSQRPSAPLGPQPFPQFPPNIVPPPEVFAANGQFPPYPPYPPPQYSGFQGGYSGYMPPTSMLNGEYPPQPYPGAFQQQQKFQHQRSRPYSDWANDHNTRPLRPTSSGFIQNDRDNRRLEPNSYSSRGRQR